MMGSDPGRLVSLPQIVVLAGGLGTRLGTISDFLPKSLVEVAGRPILSHILDWAGGQGCNRAIVLTGHLGEMFEGFVHPTIELDFYKESSPLGTGGALWNSRDLLEERFILLWGDDLHQIDYRDLLDTHSSLGCGITMTVTSTYEPFNLEHKDGFVIRYDKGRSHPEGLNGYEAGTSVVERSVLEEYGIEGSWSWEERVYEAISGSIAAHIDDSPFWDMGTPSGLERLERFLDSR